MKRVIAFLVLSAAALVAQKPEFVEGLGQGYNGEWTHVSRQLTRAGGSDPAPISLPGVRLGRALHWRSFPAHCRHELLSS